MFARNVYEVIAYLVPTMAKVSKEDIAGRETIVTDTSTAADTQRCSPFVIHAVQAAPRSKQSAKAGLSLWHYSTFQHV